MILRPKRAGRGIGNTQQGWPPEGLERAAKRRYGGVQARERRATCEQIRERRCRSARHRRSACAFAHPPQAFEQHFVAAVLIGYEDGKEALVVRQVAAVQRAPLLVEAAGTDDRYQQSVTVVC